MAAVVDRGTAAAAASLGRPAAGKTGTTNDNTDAWFVGFTGRALAAVWIGFDDPTTKLGPTGDGAHAALPLWMRAIRAAEGDRPKIAVPGEPPSGMERVVDRPRDRPGRRARRARAAAVVPRRHRAHGGLGATRDISDGLRPRVARVLRCYAADMFGMGGSEILVILIVALLFLGPDKLPGRRQADQQGNPRPEEADARAPGDDRERRAHRRRDPRPQERAAR